LILALPIATASNAAAFGTTEVGWTLQNGGTSIWAGGFERYGLLTTV